MKSLKIIPVLIIGVSLFLSACVPIPKPEHASGPFEKKQTVEYIFPTNVDFNGEVASSMFSSLITIGGNGIPVLTFQDSSLRMFYNTNDSVLNAEMRNQAFPEFYTAYSAKVAIDKKSDNIMIDFKPLTKDYVFRQSSTPLGMKSPPYEVLFSEQDFLNCLCSASVSFRDEINSPYSPESIDSVR